VRDDGVVEPLLKYGLGGGEVEVSGFHGRGLWGLWGFRW